MNTAGFSTSSYEFVRYNVAREAMPSRANWVLAHESLSGVVDALAEDVFKVAADHEDRLRRLEQSS